MKVNFNTIAIGKTFTGPVEPAKRPFTGLHYIKYIKLNKSTARAIEQHGYGNTRLVDGLFSFAPFSKIITN